MYGYIASVSIVNHPKRKLTCTYRPSIQENNPGESESSLVASDDLLWYGSQEHLAKVTPEPAQTLLELRSGCGYLLVSCNNSLMCLFTMLEKEVNIELSNADSLMKMNWWLWKYG
jgi:hypothetical protein